MRTYRLFKSELCLEQCLSLPLHLRTAITTFRISCHSLAIERGRYVRPPLPPERRLCPVCNVVEDEKHFLLVCTSSQSLPEHNVLMKSCERAIVNFSHLDTNMKFTLMMSSANSNLIYALAKFLHVAFKNRNNVYV